ncbi:MAG: hypothetical protein ACREQV_10265 [Candidatus Binatia bacterium]
MTNTTLQPHPSKKEQVATLYQLGITGIDELASLTGARPSYVANVLRDANMLHGYFDLYTTTKQPMNVYSKYFREKLGFKNTATARRSVKYIDTLYKQFGRTGDRAGQHHAMFMALIMRNRALWSGKQAEASIFASWLIERLRSDDQSSAPPTKRMETLLTSTRR